MVRREKRETENISNKGWRLWIKVRGRWEHKKGGGEGNDSEGKEMNKEKTQ
jgi:hypothetical protein